MNQVVAERTVSHAVLLTLKEIELLKTMMHFVIHETRQIAKTFIDYQEDNVY